MSIFDTQDYNISSPFWLIVEMSDMLRHFFQILQLREEHLYVDSILKAV